MDKSLSSPRKGQDSSTFSPKQQQQGPSSLSFTFMNKTTILKCGLIGSVLVVICNIVMLPSWTPVNSLTIMSKEDNNNIWMNNNNNNNNDQQHQQQLQKDYQSLQSKYDELQKHHSDLEIKYDKLLLAGGVSKESDNIKMGGNDTKNNTKANRKSSSSSSISDGGTAITTTTTTKTYKINLWDDSTHFKRREEMFNIEGWSNHPQTTIVQTPHEADLIIWVTTRARTELEIPPVNYSNVVILDYADGCTLHQARGRIPKHNLIGYFKRSFVRRQQGIYVGNCTNDKSVLPMAYSGSVDILLQQQQQQPNINNTTTTNTYEHRPILITNNLRTNSNHNMNRAKIVNWTKQFVITNNIPTSKYIISGSVGRGSSGSKWDQTFLKHLQNCKIIVTANPNSWEGDFRLWEALLSGALVLVDRMSILDMLPHPFVDKKHILFYDSTNQTQFNELLSYYIQNDIEAKNIALAGYQHTIQHHMATDRVSYILDNIRSKIVL